MRFARGVLLLAVAAGAGCAVRSEGRLPVHACLPPISALEEAARAALREINGQELSEKLEDLGVWHRVLRKTTEEVLRERFGERRVVPVAVVEWGDLSEHTALICLEGPARGIVFASTWGNVRQFASPPGEPVRFADPTVKIRFVPLRFPLSESELGTIRAVIPVGGRQYAVRAGEPTYRYAAPYVTWWEGSRTVTVCVADASFQRRDPSAEVQTAPSGPVEVLADAVMTAFVSEFDERLPGYIKPVVPGRAPYLNIAINALEPEGCPFGKPLPTYEGFGGSGPGSVVGDLPPAVTPGGRR